MRIIYYERLEKGIDFPLVKEPHSTKFSLQNFKNYLNDEKNYGTEHLCPNKITHTPSSIAKKQINNNDNDKEKTCTHYDCV